MSFSSSSSLAFSDGKHSHGMTRHSSGLLKNTSERVSKQSMMSHRMFGSKRGSHGKDFKVGSKMFRKKGKGVLKSMGDIKSGGISPSVEEFDDMLGGQSKKSKKMFSRRSFG